MRRRWILFAVGAVSLVACARILGLRPEGSHAFEHRAHVLQGIHCLRCHTGVTNAGEASALHLPDADDCRECHEDPHDDGNCTTCHTGSGVRDATAAARKYLRFTHKNHVPRVRGDCVQCHVDIAAGDSNLRPSMATCFGCHQHSEQFALRECDACHVDLEVERVRPRSHVVHDGDFLREHGSRASGARDLCATCHSESYCAGCHGAGTAAVRPERLAFDDPFAPGVHRAGFRYRHAEEARGNPGLCTTCHSVNACASCHEDNDRRAPQEGIGSPHPPGWLGLPGERNAHGAAAHRDPGLCASCHGGAGEALCIGCHRVGGLGGNPHPPGWSSNLRRNIDAGCRPCHELLP